MENRRENSGFAVTVECVLDLDGGTTFWDVVLLEVDR
ncbi:MAG: hypothetical protein ACI9VR_000944, partial [Cognaticolwellia sp.]